jgi:lipoprotein-anchoring transpeptidase ErfK/SrfK
MQPGGVSVTDLATKPGAGSVPEDAYSGAPGSQVATSTDGGEPQTPELAWAPPSPAPRRRRTGLWLTVAAGVVGVALVASSLILIAPGTTVAGVPIGGMTAGGATDAITQRLASTTVVLTGAGGDVELTGADLGASVNAREMADQAFAQHPMWNVTEWFPAPIDPIVRLDAETASSALRAAAPELYVDPVDATLAFDPETVSYVSAPAELGVGIDVEALRAALETAFVAGETRVEFAPVTAPVEAATPTFVAESTARQLNGILAEAGFYVGAERVVAVPRDVAASWLSVAPGERGTFAITADEAAIEEYVPGLAAAVDREPVDATLVTNSAGDVLREDKAGVDGWLLGDTSDVAADYAAQLATGAGAFPLPVTVTEHETTMLARWIEVNLSQQRAYLYENNKVVGSYVVSSGTSASPTPAGRFTVNGYSRIQSMGCFDGAPYCVRDVPWVTWFAPDIGFHGASALRSSLGYPQSHGCVNMWDDSAKLVYDWTALGTEVWVHY